MHRLTNSILLLLASSALDVKAQDVNLEIYWIDVEGGAATLIVTPSRESVLMDAGWDVNDGRDAERIQAAMNDAGVNELDYFIASHFHGDHVGGLPALAERVPIRRFIDHGDSVERTSERHGQAWEIYLSVAEGNRRSVVPGDKLSLDGVDFTIVTSNGEITQEALVRHDPNAQCAFASPPKENKTENGRSVGYLLSMEGFQFLNLGDLTPDIQHELACPEYLLPVVDILQVPHHGNGVAPELIAAANPTVAVLNNGPRKGGSPEGFDALKVIPDLLGIWQLHWALDTDVAHNAPEHRTANLSEEYDGGYWIKAEIRADGSSYTLMNARTGFRDTYISK